MPSLPSRPGRSARPTRSRPAPWRRSVRRLVAACAGLPLGLAALLAPATLAYGADEYTNSVAAFGNADPVYVSPDASVTVDETTLEDGVAGSPMPILVAVVPASAGGAKDLSLQLVRDFPQHTVAVVAGNGFAASSDAVCPGVSAQLASKSADQYGEQLGDGGDVTPMVTDFMDQVRKAPTSDCPATLADPAGGGGTSSIWLWLIAIGVAGLVASGFVVRQLRRRKFRQLAGRRDEIEELRDELDSRLRGLESNGDPSAAHALADAAERRSAGVAQLSGAETDDEYDAARRALLESMTAVHYARTVLHRDPGPVPSSPADPIGPWLPGERDVRYADEIHRGHPDYTPGAPHFFAGDGTTPCGWYAVPFWESTSIGAVFARSYDGGPGDGEGREPR